MTEMDLSCSESSADLSSEFDSPFGNGESRCACVKEFRLMSRADARYELERLKLAEQQTAAPAEYLPAAGIMAEERRDLVDKLVKTGEDMNFSFITICLAVNLLDRFLATSRNLHTYLMGLAAAVCLSIAGKLEEVFITPRNTDIYACMVRRQPQQSSDLFRMELRVLTALGWRAMGVTAASMVPSLVSLVDFNQPEIPEATTCKTLYLLQEGSNSMIAQCMREASFLRYQPSVLAMAAILLVLRAMSSSTAELLPASRPLQQFCSKSEASLVEECEKQMQPKLASIKALLEASDCELQVEEEGNGVLRIYRQSGSTTPKSVLQAAGQLHCTERLCYNSLQSPAAWL